jgi:outer membrane murein-binding lipoprotein Lpp
MVLDTQNLILLIVFVIVGVVVIICCVYCCSCKPAWANTRRRLVNRQVARDEEAIDQEREANRAQLQDKLTANQQARNEIRSKYELR